MSRGMNPDAAGDRDILDRMHIQGKRRDERIPEADIEKTLRLVRAVRDLGTREAGPANFWSALSVTDQGDLLSAAQKRTFPAGAVLMREGEHAGSVLVVLDGRVKAWVHEQGRERTVAERGPGDVVGEQGATPGGVRSATVVTLEPVLALVMTTEDFAVFASEHPEVPDIVKQYSYDRLLGRPDPPG